MRVVYIQIKVICTVVLLLYFSFSEAQMIKLLPENKFEKHSFGEVVKIANKKIFINQHEYNVDNFKSQRQGLFYLKTHVGVEPLELQFESNRIHIIPEINTSSWTGMTPVYSKFKDDYYIQVDEEKFSPETGILNIFQIKENNLIKIDTIHFNSVNKLDTIYYLVDFNISGDWLFTRTSFAVHYNQINDDSVKTIDNFYSRDGNDFKLVQSIPYLNISDGAVFINRFRRNVSVMIPGYIFVANDILSLNNQKGYVYIYKLVDNDWVFSQVLFSPLPIIYSGDNFGSKITVSPDGKYLAVTQSDLPTDSPLEDKRSGVHIYEKNEEGYELMQTLIFYDFRSIRLSMDNKRLFVSDTEHVGNIIHDYGRGKVLYYELENGIWKYKSWITPPQTDSTYWSFGSAMDHEEETVIVGAIQDTTYGERYYPYPDGQKYWRLNGAAYVFQVPARDTLDVRICEGESYWFGEEALTMSGVYRDTLLASYGVDSVLVLNLSVSPFESEVDTILCSGQKMTVGDQTLEEAGYYTIPLKTIYGCDSIVSVSLSYAYLDMEAEVNPDFGCQNGKISLLIQGNNPPYSYQWSNGAITSENLTDLSPGLYAVTVTDRGGCSFTLNDIEIKEEKVFELPNAFIPTSQMEENQRFRPYLFPGFEETVTITEMDIFNRFGEKVYSGTDTMGWDGTFRGEPSPPGSYLFRILLSTPCGEEMRTGSLLLVR